MNKFYDIKIMNNKEYKNLKKKYKIMTKKKIKKKSKKRASYHSKEWEFRNQQAFSKHSNFLIIGEIVF